MVEILISWNIVLLNIYMPTRNADPSESPAGSEGEMRFPLYPFSATVIEKNGLRNDKKVIEKWHRPTSDQG